MNDRFQENTLELTLEEKGFPVVHLATHGQFSSNLEDTFILTWDDRITINEFPQLLQSGEAPSGHFGK
ncbi:CHAT domain-containing protein [Halothece sp. PCC 7418]|uniref:CHAT domain-containing protein n=1 Tax=Halothece sp. (strain PCC 7418) TaxID=65093 RepID=UPI0037BE59BF